MSLDATSRIREGREAELWVDTRRMHFFDPESGDNLTRDEEAGAELTRQVDRGAARPTGRNRRRGRRATAGGHWR